MRVGFEKSKAEGKAVAPPSKSVAHRTLIACALACGKSEVVGISDSEDMLATLDCVKALNVSAHKDGDVVEIRSNVTELFNNDVSEKENVLQNIGEIRNADVTLIDNDLHNGNETKCDGEAQNVCVLQNGDEIQNASATQKDNDLQNPDAARRGDGQNIGAKNFDTKNENSSDNGEEINDGNHVFDCRESGSTLRFFIPIASVFFDKSVFVGSKRLIERGAQVYEKALGENGVSVKSDGEKIVVEGRLKCGEYVLPGDVSSQYVSGLMFALPLLEGDSKIVVKEPVESRAYVDLTVDVLKKAGIEINEKRENVFCIRGNQRYRNGKYFVEGDWSNGAMLLAFDEIGGSVEVENLDDNSVQGDKICKEIFKKLNDKNAVVDLANCPDLAPVAFVVAALKNGATFTGTKRLKIKESDRATAMAQELHKFGIEVEVHENDVVVHKNDVKTPCCDVCSHNDHRIVMACSVLLSKVGGHLVGAEAVKKSFPNFFETIGELGVKYEIE